MDGQAGGRAARKPTYRPARVGRASAGAEREASQEGLLLAEIAQTVAQLRFELQERLSHEAEARRKLESLIQQLLGQSKEGLGLGGPGMGGRGQGGESGSAGIEQIPGIAPAKGQGARPGSSSGSSSGSGRETGSGSMGARPEEGAPPSPPSSSGAEARYENPQIRGGGQESGTKDGGGAVSFAASQDPNTVHMLAQANFDLAEALNENLRNLKEIVDRSQELVARIESILRRHFRGRQGA